MMVKDMTERTKTDENEEHKRSNYRMYACIYWSMYALHIITESDKINTFIHHLDFLTDLSKVVAGLVPPGMLDTSLES